MQRGEWWVDDGGQLTFADGDVGDFNHEGYAFYAALGLDMDNPVVELTEETARNAGVDPEDYGGSDAFPVELNIEVGHLSDAEAAALLEAGSDPQAVKFFRETRQADARDYAVQHMGWIRVKGKNAEVWEFNDDALGRIKRADFWDEEDEESDEELFIEEVSTRNSWSIPFKLLFKAQSAEGLKRYMESDVRKWHGVDGVDLARATRRPIGLPPRTYRRRS